MILDDLAACSDKVREFAKDAHVIRVPFRVCPFTVRRVGSDSSYFPS